MCDVDGAGGGGARHFAHVRRPLALSHHGADGGRGRWKVRRVELGRAIGGRRAKAQVGPRRMKRRDFAFAHQEKRRNKCPTLGVPCAPCARVRTPTPARKYASLSLTAQKEKRGALSPHLVPFPFFCFVSLPLLLSFFSRCATVCVRHACAGGHAWPARRCCVCLSPGPSSTPCSLLLSRTARCLPAVRDGRPNEAEAKIGKSDTKENRKIAKEERAMPPLLARRHRTVQADTHAASRGRSRLLWRGFVAAYRRRSPPRSVQLALSNGRRSAHCTGDPKGDVSLSSR